MGVGAVILGILAIGCGLLGTMMFGTAGAIAAAVLAAVAIVLGFLKRKRDGKGGIAGIVISVLAIILAFSMSSLWSEAFRTLHEKAVELKPDGLWAKVTVDANGGLMGLVSKLPQDEASLQAFVDEMNELNQMSGGTAVTTTTTTTTTTTSDGTTTTTTEETTTTSDGTTTTTTKETTTAETGVAGEGEQAEGSN